jgi:hypothetical protein
MARTKIWVYNPRLKRRAIICVENNEAVRIKKHGNCKQNTPEQEKPVHFSVRKLRRFAETILKLPGVTSVREAAKLGGVNRETAKKYLSILKKGDNSLLLPIKVANKEIYFVRNASAVQYLGLLANVWPEISRNLDVFVDVALNPSQSIDEHFWHCNLDSWNKYRGEFT